MLLSFIRCDLLLRRRDVDAHDSKLTQKVRLRDIRHEAYGPYSRFDVACNVRSALLRLVRWQYLMAHFPIDVLPTRSPNPVWPTLRPNPQDVQKAISLSGWSSMWSTLLPL